MISNSFINIFACSPIIPMTKHMDKIYDCTKHLSYFVESALQENWYKAEKQHSQIMILESEADELKKSIRMHLPSSLFLPMARSDLLGLLTSQDKVASKAKHIASIIFGRRMNFPKTLKSQFQDFVKTCIETVGRAKQAINELNVLVETGFKGKEVDHVEKLVLDLDNLERETDYMQVAFRQALFDEENSLNPIDVIFMYQVIDYCGDMADKAHNVGHRLESILAR